MPISRREAGDPRQYFKFVRRGAVRIDAGSTSDDLDPNAFINQDGGYVVVVNAGAGGEFMVSGLPAGSYGRKYTTSTQYNIDLSDVAITGGEPLSAAIPQARVITLYALQDGCLADLNGDAAIDAADLAVLLGSWGPNPGIPADIDGDGVVGSFDLALLLGNWKWPKRRFIAGGTSTTAWTALGASRTSSTPTSRELSPVSRAPKAEETLSRHCRFVSVFLAFSSYAK